MRLPPDFAIEASRRAGNAPRGVEFSTALDREETVEELLERFEHVKSGTTIRLHVPREALALQTLEEYDMLEALQERRQVRVAVVSSNATVVGMAWLYGFEVATCVRPARRERPRPPRCPMSMSSNWVARNAPPICCAAWTASRSRRRSRSMCRARGRRCAPRRITSFSAPHGIGRRAMCA